MRAAVLLMFLVLLVLFLVIMLVAQHVRADCARNQSTNGTQSSTAHLVTEKRTTSTSYECRTQTALAICGTARRTRLAVLTRLLAVALLLLVLIAVTGLLSILLLTILLVVVLVLLVLCWWRVRRVATVGIVALIVLALRCAVVVLLGRVLIMRRW